MTTKTQKPRLQLSGEDGNIFFILSRARKTARLAGWTTEQIDAMTKECESGDYDHALQTLMEHFEVR